MFNQYSTNQLSDLLTASDRWSATSEEGMVNFQLRTRIVSLGM